MKPPSRATDVRARLIEVGGRTTQDLGLGRIVGQVLACVYLAHEDKSLDETAAELGLSKASVSIAARQLEKYGLLQRVWRQGDRKNYYRVVDHFGVALQRGLLTMIQGKVDALAGELNIAKERLGLDDALAEDGRFVKDKVLRAKEVCDRAQKLLGSPILGFVDDMLKLRGSF